MLDADGGCDSAVTTRVRSAWKVLWILTHSNMKRVLFKTERRAICYLCESCLVHGIETEWRGKFRTVPKGCTHTHTHSLGINGKWELRGQPANQGSLRKKNGRENWVCSVWPLKTIKAHLFMCFLRISIISQKILLPTVCFRPPHSSEEGEASVSVSDAGRYLVLHSPDFVLSPLKI